nr:MAG TPA: hypothetical protein [Caudoviricetes sp.]
MSISGTTCILQNNRGWNIFVYSLQDNKQQS